jgi:hypothetical protein
VIEHSIRTKVENSNHISIVHSQFQLIISLISLNDFGLSSDFTGTFYELLFTDVASAWENSR